MHTSRCLVLVLSLVNAWIGASAAQSASAQDAQRVFGRPQDEQHVAPVDSTSLELQQLRREVDQLRAQQNAPGPRQRRADAGRGSFDLYSLALEDQTRYLELEAQSRSIWLPVSLVVLGGLETLGVLLPFVAFANDDCCQMPGRTLLAGISPGIAMLVSGSVLLRRRLPRRREFEYLTRRGARATIAANASGFVVQF